MAAARIIGEGTTITITAGGTVTVGDVYEGTGGIGVYQESAVSGEAVAVLIAGEVEVDKETGVALAVLDAAYWDAANDRVDATDTNIPAGLVTQAAGTSATRVRIKLNG